MANDATAATEVTAALAVAAWPSAEVAAADATEMALDSAACSTEFCWLSTDVAWLAALATDKAFDAAVETTLTAFDTTLIAEAAWALIAEASFDVTDPEPPVPELALTLSTRLR